MEQNSLELKRYVRRPHQSGIGVIRVRCGVQPGGTNKADFVFFCLKPYLAYHSHSLRFQSDRAENLHTHSRCPKELHFVNKFWGGGQDGSLSLPHQTILVISISPLFVRLSFRFALTLHLYLTVDYRTPIKLCNFQLFSYSRADSSQMRTQCCFKDSFAIQWVSGQFCGFQPS